MSSPFSILHISDLHRSPKDPISNDELISALVSDRDRYTHEDPPVPHPKAVVVSGDIIQGVGLGADNYSNELADQYVVAEDFLSELLDRFVDGDRSQILIVPGNHDIDWNTARDALEPVGESDIPADLRGALHAEHSDFRWDWKSRTLYRIADPGLYESRLDAFWSFYERFYDGVPHLLGDSVRDGANLFDLFDGRLGAAAFNSCHGNDCFAFHGSIRKEVVARSHLQLNDSGRVFDLRMAVWHHSIDGPPYSTDYMDADIVRGMIGRDFRLGLYGHQHRTQVAPHEVWLPDRERMAVISAGSLCAGANELPIGVHRQYNVLEIGEEMRSVRVHVRAMTVANLFSRGYLMEFGGGSYADLDWNPPRSAVGSVVNTAAQRARKTIDEAEYAAKTGSPKDAIKLLQALELPPLSYERQLFLSAATESEDWSAVVQATDEPATIEELVQRVEAFNRLGEPARANAALDDFSERLHVPEALRAELRRRVSAQGKF